MASGITTILSRSAIPEKIADVMEKASENKQQATVVVAQHEAEERVKTVKKMDGLFAVSAIRKEKDKERQKEKNKKKKHNKEQDFETTSGKNLDLEA